MEGDGIHVPPNHAHFTSGPGFSNTQGSFAFRKRWGQIDWRKLASVDVDHIAKAMDFQILQENIMNIAFCNVETEFHGLDPNFTKLFRMAQLIIEYLLHSQQYLSNQTAASELQLQQVHQELEKARSTKKTSDEELRAVKKENRKRRKVIEAYQDMINAGATGLHACSVCKREFVSHEYLQSHMQRRHADHLSKSERGQQKENKISQEELEARLLEQMTKRLFASEKQLREEMQQKEKEMMDAQVKEFEEWKAKEQKLMANEMKEFKKPILTELDELHKEKLELEKDLHKKQIELVNAQAKRQSHIGQLEGAKELILGEVSQLNESKAEIKGLKESLEHQLQEVQEALIKKDASWSKRMQTLSSSYQEQLKESTYKLEALESSILEGSKADTSKISKQVKSLQHQLKEQEEVLKVQQDQLVSLQSRETSPVMMKIQNEVVRKQQGQQTVSTDLPMSDEESESDFESEEDEVDLALNKQFSPFSHQPMIKTIYQHNPVDMERIRQQTHAIFCETLLEKGIEKDEVGLKTSDFENRMGLLQQERQRQMQMHYNFAGHRQKVAEKLDEFSATDCKPHKVVKQKSHEASSASAGRGRPPKHSTKIVQSDAATPGHAREDHKEPPTTVKPRSEESESSSEDDEDYDKEEDGKGQRSNTLGGHFDAITSLSKPISAGQESREKEHITNALPTTSTPHWSPIVKVQSAEATGSTPHQSPVPKVQSAEAASTTSHQSPVPKVQSAEAASITPQQSPIVNLHSEAKKDPRPASPWDSSEDSVEGIFATRTGRTSSTPIKPDDHVLPSIVPQDNTSLDSFDFSSSNGPISAIPQHSKTNPAAIDQLHGSIPQSKTATSQSALTNVSVDDFNFSDLSDITL